jgi:hypothetical protein
MASLDIFNDDAFQVTSLSQTITDIPDVPTILGDMGLFREYGITGLSMMIERQGSSLKLLPTAPRGGVREPVALGPRKMITLSPVHIPEVWTVMADEVQGVRQFGSETEVKQVQDIVREKLAVARGNMDLTLEYHRVGALKGQVKDVDGSVLLDVYQAFGMTQETVYYNIATASSGDPKVAGRTLKRKIKEKLGGRSFSGVDAIVSEGFFDKLVDNDAMKKAWELWNNGAYLRQDQGDDADFEFAGVRYKVYSGGTSAGDFIEDGYGYAFPRGVPGMFQMAFAPANYVETVNTPGRPFYAKQEPMKFGKGIEGECQSNPLAFNSLPEAVIRISAAANGGGG